jgi:hypothetical protein
MLAKMEWLKSIPMAINGPLAIRPCANQRLLSTETGTLTTLEDLARAGAIARSAVRPFSRRQARHG